MGITVVNMIPSTLSSETNRDSEPNLSVNPANPLQIAGSAFTPDPAGSGSGPIFVSLDGGATWTLNVVLPGGDRTVDITLRFADLSNTLYAGILRYDNSDLNILRKVNFSLPGMMTTLVDRANDDQPYVEAATVMVGTLPDRVYIGNNDLSVQTTTGHTAAIDYSLDAATAPAPAGFGPDHIETRATATTPYGNQDGPSVRPAIHPDGTVYGVYFGWRTFSSPTNTTDVVVVRDDNWGQGASPFTALVDGDGNAGVRVVTGVSVPALGTLLGTQRIGSSLAIAVDPTNSQIVYIAWADGTSASNYTVHVRRSTMGGAAGSWGVDLQTVTPATNPGLAVTSQGKVGFLYQKLVNPGTGNRWQTHLVTSDDGSFSAPTDLILADVPDQNGTYTGVNPIGDYACLIAYGKDFYGAFSGNNTPDLTNFPNGVTYQRFADFVTHTLYADAAHTTTVSASIDPFFFHDRPVAPEDDLYVRDWTDSAASGDNGAEPSTHPVFYTTSDVWNRRGTLDGSPFPSDQPANEDAGNGAGNIGDNWAFARIRRNAPAASGSKLVTAHFLVSKFGTGSNYVDNTSGDPDLSFPDPDPTVTFNAADVGPFITAAYHWHLNAVASTHLCLAVEISAPGDAYVPPSLVGNAPGWPTTDLRILMDNNKAQRNMQLSTTPARGVGLGDCMYAIAHNAATFPRDMVLRVEAAPEVMKRLEGARVEVVGRRGSSMEIGSTITLKNMQPGENRWIGLSFNPPPGKEGELLFVNFYEQVGSVAVNGFAMGARLAPMARVIHDRMESHRSIFTRLSAILRDDRTVDEIEAGMELLERDQVSTKEYAEFMRRHLPVIRGSVRDLLKSQGAGDPFGAVKAISAIGAALDSGKAELIAVAHDCSLNKLDSFLTMQQLSKGNVADILQNVCWQKDLYAKAPRLSRLECSSTVNRECARFIDGYGARKIGNKEYPELIRTLLGCLRETAEELSSEKLDVAIDIVEMERNLGDLTALQKAHRDYLLKLQSMRQ